MKVLDFGLAKAWSSERGRSSACADLSQSPTLAHAGTEAGMILGTAAYMSPSRRAAGRSTSAPTSGRSASCCSRCSTGRRLFGGETVTDTLAAVLRGARLGRAARRRRPRRPPLLRRCLERDPKKRLRDIGDARIALGGHGRPPHLRPLPAAPAAARWRSPAAWAAIALVAAAAAAAGAWGWPRLRAHRRPAR